MLCALFGLAKTPTNSDAQAHRIMYFVQAKRAQSASRASTQVRSGARPRPRALKQRHHRRRAAKASVRAECVLAEL